MAKLMEFSYVLQCLIPPTQTRHYYWLWGRLDQNKESVFRPWSWIFLDIVIKLFIHSMHYLFINHHSFIQCPSSFLHSFIHLSIISSSIITFIHPSAHSSIRHPLIIHHRSISLPPNTIPVILSTPAITPPFWHNKQIINSCILSTLYEPSNLIKEMSDRFREEN